MAKSKILVIDDEAGMLHAVERILSPDHEVTSLDSPARVLEVERELRPDLVICDVSMPRADGFDVMSRLKAQRPELDVILMTGLPEPDAHLVRAIREKAFYFIQKPFNRDVMRTLVDRALELRRLREAEQHHANRMTREMAEARALQQTMLPAPSAIVNGVAIDARCIACSELGGDIFDYAPAGNGAAAAVLVADVSGHGVSAAMLTTIVKASFWSSVSDDFDPVAVVERAAEGIKAFSDRRFVTIACARIDRKKEQLHYVGAGHPPPIVRRASGAIELLDSTGPIVSPAIRGIDWERTELPIASGDRLLLYTDGLVDSLGEDGPFSRERLADLVETRGRDADVLDTNLETVNAHGRGRAQFDDFTLLTAAFAPAPCNS
jgi:serine phosphatase RsbU (regulator of sigma subunit)